MKKMKVHYITTSKNKVAALEREFEGTLIQVIHTPIDVPEPRSNDVQEIAAYKADYAYKRLERPVVAMDAGFYIHSINGFPKAFVKFALETVGLEGILRLVAGKPRECEFRECIAYRNATLAEPKCFVASTPGMLSEYQRGLLQKHNSSELHLLFIPDGCGKTLAEMSYDEYVEWRKMGRADTSAARQFAKWLLGSSI
jgi:XTP/dITP diphosphohydrolase